MEKLILDIGSSRSNPQIIKDSKLKRELVRKFIKEKGYQGLVISRRENFSWITTGGNATVLNSSNNGIGCLVFTPDKQYLVSHSMDGQRILEEQIPLQEYELVELKWYESDPLERALLIAGSNAAADINISGFENIFPEILDLHYPMTNLEINRLLWLGQKMNEIFLAMGDFIKSGMTEIEIAAYFQFIQAQAGITSDVLISGADQRMFKYRHPMPTDNKLYKYLMLHSAPNKWGLHTPITRYFSLGEPDKQLIDPFHAVAEIQAKVLQILKPGIPYSQMFTLIKQAYSECGYENEWKNHFQGGPTGYIIVDGHRLLSKKLVKKNMPFEWFFTVPGAKMAELILLKKTGPEIASNKKPWPQITVQLGKYEVNLPGIFAIN